MCPECRSYGEHHSDYIVTERERAEQAGFVCLDCGNKHFGPMDQNHVATWSYGVCDICGEHKYGTEPRDFRTGSSRKLSSGTASSQTGQVAVPDDDQDPSVAIPLVEQLALFEARKWDVLATMRRELDDPLFVAALFDEARQRMAGGFPAYGSTMFRWSYGTLAQNELEEVADRLVYGCAEECIE